MTQISWYHFCSIVQLSDTHFCACLIVKAGWKTVTLLINHYTHTGNIFLNSYCLNSPIALLSHYVHIHIRGVTISYFHYIIIMAKIIHNNNIITICIENLNEMLSVKFMFNFVYCTFCLFWRKEAQHWHVGRWRESVIITAQKCTKSVFTLNG